MTGRQVYYRYHSLAPESREIRLLELLPTRGSAASSLSCRVRKASLAEIPTPQYEAVSYVWGDPDPSEHILVNRKTLRVPARAYLALRRLAFPDKSRTIWIDAVCINQTDLAERSRQVALMQDIYRSAMRGLVYLGEESEWTRPAFETIEALLPEMKQDIGFAANLLAALWKGNRWERSQVAIKAPFEERNLRALYDLSWFSRVWIVQEASLTAQNICIWGSSTMNLDDILGIAAWLVRAHLSHLSRELQKSDGIVNATNLCLARIDCQQNGGRTISNNFSHVRNLRASDTRDKVYGTLGLIRNEDHVIGSELLTPNYTKSVREVLQDATRQGILTPTAFGLDILRDTSHRSEADLRCDSYASWTMRIDRGWDDDIDPTILPNHPDEGVAVMAARKLVDKSLLGSLRLSHLISINGVELDAIESISSMPNPSPNAHEVWAWISEIESLCTSGAASTPPTDHQLMRLLIADVNWSGMRSSHADLPGFSLLLTRLKKGLGIELSDASTGVVQAENVYHALSARCKNRRVAISRGGYHLLVPKLTAAGDLIVELTGGLYPFILRPRDLEFLLMGECYIDGAMPWQGTEYADFKQTIQEKAERIFNII